MSRRLGDGADEMASAEAAKAQKDLLWGDYLELMTQRRHVETVRMNALNLVLVLTSALAALITFDKVINRADLVPSLIITVLGVASFMFSLDYLQRYVENSGRAEAFRAELDRRFFPHGGKDLGLAALRTNGETWKPKDKDVGLTRRYHEFLAGAKKRTGPTHLFGVVMPLLVFILGIVLVVLSLTGAQGPTQ